jgi:hypothetical protein
MTPQSVTVAEFMQLVHGRLEPGDIAHLWLDGSELISDESFEDHWVGGLIVLAAGNDPPDAQHLERLLGAKTGIRPSQPQLAPQVSPAKIRRPAETAHRRSRARRPVRCNLQRPTSLLFVRFGRLAVSASLRR